METSRRSIHAPAVLVARAGVAALFAVLVVSIAVILPASAAPAGEIVIHGAPGGAHLRLGLREGTLLVQGPTEPAQSRGCSFGQAGEAALCPLSGIDRIELVMGDAADRINVSEPLPVPLTARLGGGSDKFIGNAEPDTCYSEGARRNRCIGGAGDDVCITGNENSDCVGGPGDDYCRHGAGSDGCWGGPGNDVCVMGAGEDGCHGGTGDDRLFAGPDFDQLYGGPGRDYCDGRPGLGHSYQCEEGPGG
jgi:RTX calcium-binding nonapeptide repeat (4 copies)